VATEPVSLTQPRLGPASLDALDARVQRPSYDRATVGCGIVHLGVGAFMRAHVAVYCDDVLRTGDDWGIAGVSLRRPDVSRQLAPQDCLYTVRIGAESSEYRLVGSLRSIAVAPEDPGATVDSLASPSTRVVTITVTEKGYCIDPHRGGLAAEHPDIVHDLAHPAEPRSLVGLLYAACRQRRDRSAGGITVLSCDNLPSNGALLRRAVLDFASLSGGELGGWIERNVAFPSSMIDRIVPATTPDDIAQAASETGVVDEALVCTEPFTQWVIEDQFARGRPRWEDAGALLVPDVAPYEAAKLRLLNGAHSTLAYLGYLAGYQYVHEVMGDAVLSSFVERMMVHEISPVTQEPAGMEHRVYIAQLLERFRNPSLRHRTWQIAMDGSQKLPQRLLASIGDQRGSAGHDDGLCIAVAAWMRYVLGTDEEGGRIDVSDPLADTFAQIAADCGDDNAAIVARFLDIGSVFPVDLAGDTAFAGTLVRRLAELRQFGARETARRFLENEST